MCLEFRAELLGTSNTLYVAHDTRALIVEYCANVLALEADLARFKQNRAECLTKMQETEF